MVAIQAKPRSPVLRRGNSLSMGLINCLPFTEGGGIGVYDLATARRRSVTVNAGTLSWVGSPWGPSCRITQSGTPDSFMRIDSNAVDTYELTVFCMFDFFAATAINSVAWSYRDNLVAFGDSIRFIGGSTTASTWTLDQVDSTSVGTGGFTSITASTKYQSNFSRRRISGADGILETRQRSLSNGELEYDSATSTGFTTNLVADTNTLWCRSNGAASYTDFLSAGYIAFFAWKRALSIAEELELIEDPFGWITPRKRDYFFYSPFSAGASTNLSWLNQQGETRIKRIPTAI